MDATCGSKNGSRSRRRRVRTRDGQYHWSGRRISTERKKKGPGKASKTEDVGPEAVGASGETAKCIYTAGKINTIKVRILATPNTPKPENPASPCDGALFRMADVRGMQNVIMRTKHVFRKHSMGRPVRVGTERRITVCETNSSGRYRRRRPTVWRIQTEG